MWRAGMAAALFCAALATPACRSSPQAGATPSASADATPAAPPRPPTSTTARPTAHHAGPPPEQAPRCRAIDVQGSVTRHGSGALEKGTLLDARSWLELDRGASVTFRHVDSARELTIKGPAYVTVCPHGEEEVLLTRGELTTSTGPGARPGAEVLVATPYGAVVYGNAKLDVRVDARGLELAVQAGDAWVRPASGATLKGADHVMSGKTARLTGGKVEPDRLLEECGKAAEDAARRARELLARRPEAGAGGLGDRAARHVRARQAARERCAVAGAAVGLTPDPAERQHQWALLGRSERLWMTVPVRPE